MMPTGEEWFSRNVKNLAVDYFELFPILFNRSKCRFGIDQYIHMGTLQIDNWRTCIPTGYMVGAKLITKELGP